MGAVGTREGAPLSHRANSSRIEQREPKAGLWDPRRGHSTRRGMQEKENVTDSTVVGR